MNGQYLEFKEAEKKDELGEIVAVLMASFDENSAEKFDPGEIFSEYDRIPFCTVTCSCDCQACTNLSIDYDHDCDYYCDIDDNRYFI